jgi:hypothetical protein
MAAKQTRVQKTLGIVVAVCILTSVILRWNASQHSQEWRIACDGLGLLCLLLWLLVIYKFRRNISAADPATHLFPKSSEDSLESHNQ